MTAPPAAAPLVVLLTGFGPFPGAPTNPAAALVRRLARLRRPRLAGTRLVAHVFPTRYRAIDRDLPALLESCRPDVVLMFGLAPRRRHISVETRARNTASKLVPDAGGGFSSAVIAPGGPAMLRFDVPARELARAISLDAISARVSHDAGRYVCNYLSWRVLEAAASPMGPAIAVFVHVPMPRSFPLRRGGRRSPPAMHELQRAAEAVLLSVIAIGRARERMKRQRQSA